ncbi:MAG: hypothetical protein GXP47_05845, partial [Acidobacteria bacterium]|nr:hypothetical protein [Acidobacteriota bacterium]
EPVTGGILHLEDALTLVRHMVVGEEVRKPDILARVEVAIEERSHRLTAIPFERHGDRLRCAVSGVEITPPPKQGYAKTGAAREEQPRHPLAFE